MKQKLQTREFAKEKEDNEGKYYPPKFELQDTAENYAKLYRKKNVNPEAKKTTAVQNAAEAWYYQMQKVGIIE